jgi:hypothetical protein
MLRRNQGVSRNSTLSISAKNQKILFVTFFLPYGFACSNPDGTKTVTIKLFTRTWQIKNKLG